MGRGTFKGGIHPYDGKELSKDKPIYQLLPKGEMVYPLSQHIGAPAKAIVSPGDTVRKGQKIAEADGFVSVPIYATVSGKVKAICPRRVPGGSMVNSIVIENDGAFQTVEFQPQEDVSVLSREEILDKIKDAGIVGMGGAGFPTHVKLSPKEPQKINYVIANCAECEPYLTSDYRRMLEEPEKLIGGLKIVLQLFPNAKGYLGVEDNKPDCIEKLQNLVKEEPNIEVVSLHTKYPQGSERQLIYAVSGQSIHAAMLPADAGCIVNNVDTLVAIYHAVKLGEPLMQRIVTVTGQALFNPGNMLVAIGTSHGELVETAGGFRDKPKKVISGGPMMGTSLFDLEVPVTKTSSALLCLTKDEVAQYQPTACINCGRCVSVCPSRIVPSRLADYSQRSLSEAFEQWNGLECVECGSCSYICPAKRHLAQSIRAMKRMVLANKRK